MDPKPFKRKNGKSSKMEWTVPQTSGEKFQMDNSLQNKVSKLIFWSAVVTSQVIGGLCIGLAVYWCLLNGGFAWESDANLQFNYHPLFMILGLIFFYGDAIIIYRVLSFVPKPILKIIHASLHVCAIIFSSIALAAVFENHRRTNRADLYSLHSWIGIGTFSFFCLQYVFSFAAFMIPGLPMRWRAKIMPFHTFFGIGIFVLAAGTAQMGLTEKLLWSDGYTAGRGGYIGYIGNVIGLLIIVFSFLIIFITTRSEYKRKPLPNEVPQSSVN